MVLSAGAEFLLLCTVLQIPWRTDRVSDLRGKRNRRAQRVSPCWQTMTVRVCIRNGFLFDAV